jgi:hypothetical protein
MDLHPELNGQCVVEVVRLEQVLLYKVLADTERGYPRL